MAFGDGLGREARIGGEAAMLPLLPRVAVIMRPGWATTQHHRPDLRVGCGAGRGEREEDGTGGSDASLAAVVTRPRARATVQRHHGSGQELYVEVDEGSSVRLFYYFVRSKRSPLDDPLMLWLTSRPGCSVLITVTGLAYKIGLQTLFYCKLTSSHLVSVL
ncbi:hypothetical protein PR202_gb07609 [Eleusine coracana subsp. coracana]|uniref:Uncharacterized protein n=1 Tax=Eleusine coracana subsp. coracana TaxID=191504 RepID=A0AAV5ECP2_ELECO|nr:hypothetical protein PR202_gb07609 [Eleusine coracana subsp. coracana]